MSGGKVVKEEHKNAPHAKESSKNVKFKHKGQLKKQNTMKEEDLFDLTLKVVRERGARKGCEKEVRERLKEFNPTKVRESGQYQSTMTSSKR